MTDTEPRAEKHPRAINPLTVRAIVRAVARDHESGCGHIDVGYRCQIHNDPSTSTYNAREWGVDADGDDVDLDELFPLAFVLPYVRRDVAAGKTVELDLYCYQGSNRDGWGELLGNVTLVAEPEERAGNGAVTLTSFGFTGASHTTEVK